VNSVSVAGTYDIGLYSEDGSYQITNATTPTLSAAGVASTTFTAVTINPGMYYVGFIANGTANVAFTMYDLPPIDAPLSNIGGEPRMAGEVTGQADGTLPASFTPSTLTDGAGIAPIWRFDN
jgi:hypothetical protein